MTASELKLNTKKELVLLAKRHQVAGWHAMKKDELVRALVSATRSKKSRAKQSRLSRGASTSQRNGKSTKAQIHGQHRSGRRSLSRTQNGLSNGKRRDFLEAEVCGRYWLKVQWEVSQQMVARAEVALQTDWHQARPVIRLFDVTSSDARPSAKTRVRDVEIHVDAQSWFVQIDDPTHSYKMAIGYVTPKGRFFTIANSRKMTPARFSHGENGSKANGTSYSGTTNGSKNDSSVQSANGQHNAAFRSSNTAAGLPKFSGQNNNGSEDLCLELDAEMTVQGATHPHAKLTVLGSPVTLEHDGSFSLRVQLPEGREVIPVEATTANGQQRQTVVLAIERNTKKLELQRLDEPEIN